MSDPHNLHPTPEQVQDIITDARRNDRWYLANKLKAVLDGFPSYLQDHPCMEPYRKLLAELQADALREEP